MYVLQAVFIARYHLEDVTQNPHPDYPRDVSRFTARTNRNLSDVLHKFHKPNEKLLYIIGRKVRAPCRGLARIPRKLANPAGRIIPRTAEKKKKGKANAQSAGEEINQNRPFDRNSAKSGKIESQRKPGRQRDDEVDAPKPSTRVWSWREPSIKVLGCSSS